MSLKKILLVAVTTLVVYGGFAMPCQAQHPLKRRTALRWLGQGFSDGYHRHNPGHDTSYYNPYTAHNSHLVSQSPEYQAILAQQQPVQRFFAGVPYSVYAAPNQLNPALQSFPGQEVQGSFSPSVGSGLLDSDEELDNSFKRSNENEDSDFREDDDDDFRDNDDAFGDDDDAFRDDDDAFRDEPMEKKESMEDMDAKDVEDLDVDTSDLGGLSGLNDSLSFDFD